MTTKNFVSSQRKRMAVLIVMWLNLGFQVLCEQKEEEPTLSTSQSWGFGILAGFGVSMIGFLMAVFIVLLKRCNCEGFFTMFIRFLYTLACGTLLGDVFLHILPGVYKTEGASSEAVTGIMVGCLVGFMILEKLMASLGVAHKHWGDDEHDHNHFHSHKNQAKPVTVQEISEHSSGYKSKRVGDLVGNSDQKNNETINQIASKNEGNNGSSNIELTEEDTENEGCCGSYRNKGSSGYMNLLGSLIHNFIDGLSTGIAFASGHSDQYIPVLVAIIAHEVPRQMGDVAILLNSRFSALQTIFCNGVVNFVSLIGAVVGLSVTGISKLAQQYVMVFVAANFLFIAADIWKNIFKTKVMTERIVEFVGLGTGLGFMYLVVVIEGLSAAHAH